MIHLRNHVGRFLAAMFIVGLALLASTSPAAAQAKAAPNLVRGLAIDPAGKLLAAGTRDGLVRLWELATGKLVHELRGHTGQVHAVAFAPDGLTLASAGLDGRLRIWDVAAGKARHVFDPGLDQLQQGESASSPRRACVLAVAFSPDGKRVATGDSHSIVRLWELASGNQRKGPIAHLGQVRCVAFSPDGKLLASCDSGGHALQLWEFASDNADAPRIFKRGLEGSSSAFVFSPNGKLLAAANPAGPMRVFDLATGNSVESGDVAIGTLSALAFTPDNKLFATLDMLGNVTMWQQSVKNDDPGARKSLRDNGGHVRVWSLRGTDQTSYFHAAAFTPDRKILAASGTAGNHIRIWDVAEGREIGAIAVPPDGGK